MIYFTIPNFIMGYGVIEYNQDGLIKCEICGEFFRRLNCHLRHTHFIPASEYKEEYGLNIKQGLWSKDESARQRKLVFDNYEKVVQRNLVEKSEQYHFKKGYKGRTKDLVREQTRIMLYNRITNVDKELIRRFCCELGKSGIGNAKRRELRYLRINHNGRTIKFDNELSDALPKLIAWSKKKYGLTYDNDITSNTILRALEWGKFDFRRGQMITWLVGMAIHMYLSKQKAKSRNRIVSIEDVHSEEDVTYQLNFDIYNEGEDRVIECIKKLSPKEQEVLLMVIDGVKVREMAIKYKVKPESMKSYLWKARYNLKSELSKINVSIYQTE